MSLFAKISHFLPRRIIPIKGPTTVEILHTDQYKKILLNTTMQNQKPSTISFTAKIPSSFNEEGHPLTFKNLKVSVPVFSEHTNEDLFSWKEKAQTAMKTCGYNEIFARSAIQTLLSGTAADHVSLPSQDCSTADIMECLNNVYCPRQAYE